MNNKRNVQTKTNNNSAYPQLSLPLTEINPPRKIAETRNISLENSEKISQRESDNMITTARTIKITSKPEVTESQLKDIDKNITGSNLEVQNLPNNSTEKYIKFFNINPSISSRFKDLSFVERCGYQLYSIHKSISIGKDIYDMIRIYADHAQESQYDQIDKIFEFEEAGITKNHLFLILINVRPSVFKNHET